MYTPLRTSSRQSVRRPPNMLAPPVGAAGSATSSGSGSSGSTGSGGSASLGAATLAAYASPSTPSLPPPQTPQQRLLRRPMSMQTLPSARSQSRMTTPRPGHGSSSEPVYRGTIHVGVRAKPELREVANGAWLVDALTNSVGHDIAGTFQFDKVYEGAASNGDVFHASAEHLIMRVVEGYNATVFAYGTTGSGKTYTMQGSAADPGVIPRSVQLLFDLLAAAGGPSRVQLSYFEIYNERVYDLLTEDRPVEVTLRDDAQGEQSIVGQRELTAGSADELLAHVAAGDLLRRTSSTQYNVHSSRSHAVVRVTVHREGRQSVLYLCDLAGSERAVVNSERRKEGAFINKSLLTLSSVISILSQGGQGHVPYRDSKLTRLLQPSLSGTALVSMLCTIQTGPLPAGGAETLNSVRFAAKAKNLTVVARRNSVFDETGISGAGARFAEQLQSENEMLRSELVKLRAKHDDLRDRLDVYESAENMSAEVSLEAMAGIGDDPVLDPTGARDQVARLAEEAAKYKAENTKLQDRITQLVNSVTQLNADVALLEKTSHARQSEPEPQPTLDSDLLVELAELRETIKDKDLVIDCLRGINNERNKLASGSSSSVSSMRLSDPAKLSPASTGPSSTTEAIQDLRI